MLRVQFPDSTVQTSSRNRETWSEENQPVWSSSFLLADLLGVTKMPVLKVDLQEGFTGETVVLRLNGDEVYRGAPKTRMQIGLAVSKSFDLPPQHLELEVTTPLSGASESLELDLFQDSFVKVNLLPDGKIDLKAVKEEDLRYI